MRAEGVGATRLLYYYLRFEELLHREPERKRTPSARFLPEGIEEGSRLTQRCGLGVPPTLRVG